MKEAKSYRVSPNITSVLSLSKPGFFLQTSPINNIVYIIFWPWRPVNILWPSFDKGFSTRKLIFPWTVFSYISNVCQPEKESKREKKKNTGWPSFFKRGPIALLLKGSFIPCLTHRGKWKMQSHTESAQTLHLFCLYRNQDYFCKPFPKAVSCTLSSGLGGPLLIKASQPENLFSLEMFFLIFLIYVSLKKY